MPRCWSVVDLGAAPRPLLGSVGALDGLKDLAAVQQGCATKHAGPVGDAAANAGPRRPAFRPGKSPCFCCFLRCSTAAPAALASLASSSPRATVARKRAATRG